MEGRGGSLREMPWHRGAAGDGRERCGLRLGSPRQLRARALSRRCLVRHCRGAATLAICSTVGCDRRGVTKGPTVTRRPGQEGQGVHCGG